jgi:crotonobetainyl-CoA:carnitine CoA-transferase CaiB-like acyl-CoA transferase
MLPLAGVRVLDLSRVLAGPFCAQLLADLGADVIKLERPGAGDDTRGWGPPFVGELSAYFLSCNRGKRSVAVDIATPDGRAVLEALLGRVDIVVENFRTDSLPKLGLDADALRRRDPKLIVCSISGYGRTGPMKDDPGYDFAIQATSGLMAITGPVDGPPSKVGVAVADVLTGLYASTAILAALHRRTLTGDGATIDLALLDCALAAQVNLAQAYLSTGTVPARQGNAHLQIVPYQLVATADGWLVLAVGNDSQWRAFCRAAGRGDWEANANFATNRQRVERRRELVPLVEAVMRSRTTADWERALAAANVPHAAVADYAGVFASEQVAARAMRATVAGVAVVGNPIHLDGHPLPLAGIAPRLGEHTASVLAEWGIRFDSVE